MAWEGIDSRHFAHCQGARQDSIEYILAKVYDEGNFPVQRARILLEKARILRASSEGNNIPTCNGIIRAAVGLLVSLAALSSSIRA